MFKKIAISLGIASITALTVYTIKVHRDNLEIRDAVVDLAEEFIQYGMDVEFADIVDGLRDIDN